MVRQPPPRKKNSRSSGTSRVARPAAGQVGSASRDGNLQALGVYERAVTALQQRRYKQAAAHFRKVIDNFPDEPELHERSRRYLAACERASQPSPTPETVEDRLYAATLALNSGLQDEALQYLTVCARERPDSDHVQYMLAVARADAGDLSSAASHLLRAVELNSDNRFLARNEPSFDRLRADAAVQKALETPDAGPRTADSDSPAAR